MRRTGRLFFDTHSVNLYKKLAFETFQNYFSWNEKTTEKHQKELENKLKEAISFE
jgi:glycerol-3-phosphate dehydrogenase